MSDSSSQTPMVAFRRFSFNRIWAIASNTLTQLIRMRAFYFLLIFSLMVLLAASLIQNFQLDQSRQLKVVKDMAFLSMSLFCTLFAIVATANLIPKDIEDRTLYTILAKPVPRLDYLLGKYLGTLLILVVSLICMTALLYGVLWMRQSALLAELEVVKQVADAGGGISEITDLEILRKRINAEGVSWSLLQGVLSIGMQATVLSAITLCISTFASSGLFTVIVSVVVYFISYIQPTVIDFWRSTNDMGSMSRVLAYLLEIAFPNFRSFNLVDGVVSGDILSLKTVGKVIGIAISYVVAFLVASYLVFAKKEL